MPVIYSSPRVRLAGLPWSWKRSSLKRGRIFVVTVDMRIEGRDLRAPASDIEWHRYFDLRWRVLRSPWDQPQGSERDDKDGTSTHVGIWDREQRPLAIGRLHLNSETQAQIRYMAVEPGHEKEGLGSAVLEALEKIAQDLGATEIVLNSRDVAGQFYARHHYTAVGKAETLFGRVQHRRMRKQLSRGCEPAG